jgi:peptidoglycan/xylan/chitin deacetylase (PgdA/CDA1 family)
MSFRHILGQMLPGGAKQHVMDMVSSTGSVAVKGRSVTLTFDDGPDPEVTPRALDALGATGAKATFFMLASRAEAYPATVARLVAEGHEIGLHGTDHIALRQASTSEVINCIRGGKRRLEQIAGTNVQLFRPPFGRQDLRSYLVARACRLEVVAWNVQVDDWLDQPVAAVIDRLRQSIAPGAVVLLHDGLILDPEQLVDPSFDRGAAIASMIAVLSESSLEGVTFSRLKSLGTPDRFPWFA